MQYIALEFDKSLWTTQTQALPLFRCEYGVLDKCYGEGNLENYIGKLNLPLEGWKVLSRLSLREAARLFNSQNIFHGGTCNCKSHCKTRKCSCRQKDAPCTSKCHQGTLCDNCPNETEDCISPPKKMKKDIVEILDTDSSLDSFPRPWLSQLNLHEEEQIILEIGQWLTDRHICAAQDFLKKQQFPCVKGSHLPINK